MTTIDELERLDREIAEAERRALRCLAAHLREAVLDMPAESKLARSFVRHAAGFEARAGSVDLDRLVSELMRQYIELMSPHDPDAAASRNDCRCAGQEGE